MTSLMPEHVRELVDAAMDEAHLVAEACGCRSDETSCYLVAQALTDAYAEIGRMKSSAAILAATRPTSLDAALTKDIQPEGSR